MAAKTFTIDSSESKVSFSVKKFGFLSIKGEISGFDGEIIFDPEDVNNSSFNVSIGASTVNTGNAKRDEHLKSKDFFFVKEFPKISFNSTSIKEKDGKYQANGTLTMLETSKAVSIPFTIDASGIKGQFSLKRKDFQLGVKPPALVVGKTIQINIHCKIK